MPRDRAHCAPLALTLDGSLLLNVSARLDPAILSRVAQALGVRPGELFIGTALAPAKRRQALSRVDDAAAEAAARIQGAAPSPASTRPRRRKRA